MGLLDRKEKIKMRDYGNGVLFFNVNGEEFASELALYLKSHSNYRISKMIPDTYDGYPCGYIVIIERR